MVNYWKLLYMNGIPSILWHYLQTKYFRRFRSREELLAWQDKQVRRFLGEVLTKSPFYSKRYAGLDISDREKLPIIDKSEMMANFDELNTVGIKKSAAFAIAEKAERSRNFSPTLNGVTVGLSSGTSGNRGLFLVSRKERYAWAGTILAKALPKPIFTKQAIAFFLRANSNLYETVNSKRIQFKFFDLFQPLDNQIADLNCYAPDILVAPPSMLRLLADARIRGDLQISPIKIISVAEVLDPLDETYISQVFGQILHQIYQCTEGFLASTCKYGTLHLNEDIVAIEKEYLDRDAGKFMPIITDFNRQSQPIIRYRLDDILTESRTICPCGSVFTAIESIEGRQDDIFYLPSKTGEKLIPIFPDFIRRAIIIASEDIREYLVVQKNMQLIEISLKVPNELLLSTREKVDRSLVELFERSQCQIPQITYSEYQPKTAQHQKLRRVKREFNLNSLFPLLS